MGDVQSKNFVDGKLLCMVLYRDVYKQQKLSIGNQNMNMKGIFKSVGYPQMTLVNAL